MGNKVDKVVNVNPTTIPPVTTIERILPFTEEKVSEFFKQIQNSTPSCDLEKLPKTSLSEILLYLPTNELGKVSTLNKYFLKLIFDSNSATANFVWKKKLEGSLEGKCLEEEVDSFYNDQCLDPLEKKLNKYCIFYKYSYNIKWDPNLKGEHINISKDLLTASTGDPFTNSWNCVLGNKPFSCGVHYVVIIAIVL